MAIALVAGLTLVRVPVQQAGLATLLSDPTTVATVFAPTDSAFANLLQATGLTATQLLADTNTLTQVLPTAQQRLVTHLVPFEQSCLTPGQGQSLHNCRA